MSTVLQFLALFAIILGIFFYGYHRGKTIKERELNDMEDPSLTPAENEKRRQYAEFCKLYDQMMTNDDFFTGDISKSSRTDTNKDELK